MDKASLGDPSKTASPVGFAKSPMRSVSLSVSLTVSLEYQKAPAASGMGSNPAAKSLVFTKDLSGANDLDSRVLAPQSDPHTKVTGESLRGPHRLT